MDRVVSRVSRARLEHKRNHAERLDGSNGRLEQEGRMIVAIVWILAQMEAPWWVVACLITATAVKTAVGFLKFGIDYGERKK